MPSCNMYEEKKKENLRISGLGSRPSALRHRLVLRGTLTLRIEKEKKKTIKGSAKDFSCPS